MSYTASGNITTQNLSTGTSTPTAGSSVALTNMDNTTGIIGLQVTGTYTGALTPWGTIDGAKWFQLGPYSLTNQTSGLAAATILSTVTGIFTLNATGLFGVRLEADASVTGTATVSMFESISQFKAPDQVNVPGQGTVALSFAQSNSDQPVKASAGYLCRVLITAAGSAATAIWDNATGHTGVILGAIPANPTVGAIYTFNAPALAGITIQGAANTSGVTVFFD